MFQEIGMWFYWAQDWVKQEQFHIFWEPDESNLNNFCTNHPSTYHHWVMRPILLKHTISDIEHTKDNRPNCVCWNLDETYIMDPSN